MPKRVDVSDTSGMYREPGAPELPEIDEPVGYAPEEYGTEPQSDIRWDETVYDEYQEDANEMTDSDDADADGDATKKSNIIDFFKGRLKRIKNSGRERKERKEEIKRQQELELYDEELDSEYVDEEEDETPPDLKERFLYLMRTNQAARIAVVTGSVVFFLIILGIAVRGRGPSPVARASDPNAALAEHSLTEAPPPIATPDAIPTQPPIESAAPPTAGNQPDPIATPQNIITKPVPEEPQRQPSESPDSIPSPAPDARPSEAPEPQNVAIPDEIAGSLPDSTVPDSPGSRGEISEAGKGQNIASSYAGSTTAHDPGEIAGYLSIPSINLENAPVVYAPDLLSQGGSPQIPGLAQGLALFPNTSSFNGTVGIAGNNSSYFQYLGQTEVGAILKYSFDGITRTYEVYDKHTGSAYDWAPFEERGDNELVLTTCEAPSRVDYRIIVMGRQIGEDIGGRLGMRQDQASTVEPESHENEPGQKPDETTVYKDYGPDNYVGTFTGDN